MHSARHREQRRDRRFRYQMPVTWVRGGREVPLLSGDVSFRGLFLRTDDPPPLRQLVQLRLRLPPGNEELAVHAMAVFAVAPGAGDGAPGVGVQLYALGDEARQRWERFVRWVAATHPESAAARVRPDPAAPDPVQRRFPRQPRTLTVRTPSVDDLQVLVTRDVSRGGKFLRTSVDVPVGAELRLLVAHPRTGQTFAVDAVVRRRVDGPPERAGIGVEFVGLDDRRREELAAFAGLDEAGAETGGAAVPEGDPRLE
ncbi:MAG TPA: PilZ domain-containing protein [Anaeromyxobacteraceae bacterium]|nr:PilZ domain-containing protein [Anaeromyxobacteraceae bacterium]